MTRQANTSGQGMGRHGGTFCRFAVGGGGRGASVRHLRYIARAEAVRERSAGILPWNLSALELSEDYGATVARLCAFARFQESEELRRHQARGQARTHYRALLSFQTLLSFQSDSHRAQAQAMVLSWLDVVFPKAPAAAFFHRNTAHLHAHVWIGARQTDGRKINLSARAFRQIDEAWNRIYAQAMGLPETEHLHKKWQTEAYKARLRAGQETERPGRVADAWNPKLFNERERERLGVRERSDERKESSDERDESGTGSNQRAASDRTDGLSSPTAALRDALAAAERGLHDAERALSEARQVHAASERLADECSAERSTERTPFREQANEREELSNEREELSQDTQNIHILAVSRDEGRGR